MKTDEKKKFLNEFMILCLAAFIAILGCIYPADHILDTLVEPHFLICEHLLTLN